MEKISQAGAANDELNDGKDAINNVSVCGYDSLHQLLAQNLKPQIFQVVFSVLLIDFLCLVRVCGCCCFFAHFLVFCLILYC